MTKGEQTRSRIIRQAAELFNKRGFTGSSITDVMERTGLRKGGIYRHFADKQQLALEAFDYAQRQSSDRLVAALGREQGAIEQLLAFVEAFKELTLHPPVPGGCPIMNTIVDNDDGDPRLLERVVAVLSRWQELLEHAIRRGISAGSIRADADPRASAVVIIATIEGGILLSRAHREPAPLQYTLEHVTHFITHDLVR